eukprot:CAMPEP_0198289370 /NCGR_PEP_ID=MMETSP1449-20131203/7570_1 /TAXON_ID=420275 /ORGANISM="Attheya septentrionalis, Strain CCMP2084" /LENGTH=468 /DNA_ID=CAMNT_0043987679 /DNA_START=179 /DNA_END=1586 /DNA_ORIENTATION=+
MSHNDKEGVIDLVSSDDDIRQEDRKEMTRESMKNCQLKKRSSSHLSGHVSGVADDTIKKRREYDMDRVEINNLNCSSASKTSKDVNPIHKYYEGSETVGQSSLKGEQCVTDLVDLTADDEVPTARSKPLAPVFEQIKIKGSDSAVITEGIISLLTRLPGGISGDILTCSGQANRIGDSLRATSTSSILSQQPFSLLHIQQKDKWSCGFRNMQMMLSAIIPQLPAHHPYFADLADNADRRNVPSLSQLESLMENSWRDGFDGKGAEHFNNRMLGRKRKIGAAEVCSLFSYLSIDATVIQFIHCPQSRSLLGHFVWCYFNVGAGRKANNDSGPSPSSTHYASELLRLAELKGKEGSHNIKSCPHHLLPLYLQWEGHSVTIVGVERTETNASQDASEFNLLVFDPLKSGTVLKEKLSRIVSGGRKNNKKTTGSFVSSIMNNPYKKSSTQEQNDFTFMSMPPVDFFKRIVKL